MNEENWFPDLPSWVPGWIPWILLAIIVVAWILDKFVFKTYLISNLRTKNKKEALDLVKDQRDIWKEEAEKLNSQLEKLKSKNQGDSSSAIDKKSKDENSTHSDEIKVKEEAIESAEPNNNFSKMLEAFENGNYEKGKEFLDKEAENERDANSRLDFLGFGLNIAFKQGFNQAFDDLKKLLENNPNDPNLSIWLSNCYSYINEKQKAQEILESALLETKNDSSKVSIVKNIADLQIEQDNIDKAIIRLKNVLKTVEDTTSKSWIYEKLGRIFEKQKQYDKAFLFYERALVHNPTDTDLRFDVAYLYSNNDAPKFALYHYRKLLGMKKHKMASNNAGVAAGNLSLPLLSTKYYKEAEEQNNTLASANLANKLLDAGFVDEAKQILSEAQDKEDVHENVYSASASISKRKANEDEEITQIYKDVEKIRKWRHEFGKAILFDLQDPKVISGTYKGKPGTLKITINENGQMTGDLYLDKLEEPAKLSGSLEGSGIRFKWSEPIKKDKEREKEKISGLASALRMPLPQRKESGILIYENEKLTGFSKSGEESLDPSSSMFSTEWELTKDE